MTAEQLRNSILQEAISGRLVPQDPNDEPASILLQHIREEKARLVKEGKLKKKDLVETPITEDEIPFEIPDSWEWARWGNLAFSIMYGYNAPAEDNGDIRMVRISDIQDNKVLWGKVPFCRIKPSDIETYLLKPNDILFARTGGTVGKSYIVNEVPYPSIYAGYLIRTQYSKQLCPKYLKYFMESRLYWSQLRDETIATAQPNCNGKKLAAMMLPLPPLAEQKRIVAKLEELLPIVEQYGKAQKELDELNAALPARLRQSILQEAFNGKLTDTDMCDWEYVTIKDICNFGRCESVDVKDIPNNAWVLELEDIEKDSARILKRLTLSERQLKGTRHKFQKGQLLYSKLRTYLNKVLIAPEDGYCTGEIVPITFKEGVSVEYMCYFMRSPFVLQYTTSCGYGIKMPRVNPKQMNSIEVPLPPLAEQQRIVAKIEELFAQIDKISK